MKELGKKALAFVIIITLISSLGATASAADFADMPASNHWAYTALNAAVSNNLLNGDNNNLNPEANLKRAEMAAILNRAFGATQEANISSYTDVLTTSWYYSDVAKAVLMGTFKGDGTNTMRPESAITRQEAFVALARALNLTDGNEVALDKYSDKALVASWAKGAVAALVSAGYVNGVDGKLNPTNNITRQEFAQLMYNTVKSYISVAGTITAVADGNVIVNVPGVTLQNLTVKGDLIVGDGVGNGDLILDHVTVEGRLVVRGGGQNTIKIINSSSASNVIIAKDENGILRVYCDDSSTIETIDIQDGKDGVIIECDITTLTVEAHADVLIKGSVGTVVVGEDAGGVEIIVEAGATVGNLITNANNIIVSGEGTITTATVNGNNTEINVVGTEVTVATGVTGTTANGEAVEGGTEIIVEEPETGGGGGGGGTPPATNYKNQIDALITNNKTAINSLLGTYAELTSFSSTADGGIIAVKHSASWSNVGDLVNYFKDLELSNYSTMINMLNSAFPYVKSITVQGETLLVDENLDINAVSDFIHLLKDNSDTFITKATLISALKTSETIIVTDDLGNNYTYTITRSVL